MKAILGGILLAAAMLALSPTAALADGGVCPRPAAGSEAVRPPDLYSKNGVLKVKFNYFTSLDDLGRTLFCFVTADGLESPTLHVNPGDTIKISLTNQVPEIPGGPSEVISRPAEVCGAMVMTLSSVNMHFHGTNTSPKCHSDEVIRTLVNSGQTFEYTLHIPDDEPPGLYWYHPHVHGISSAAVQGGATGAIEVEGIADIQPAVAGLPERYLVLRDQQLIGCCGLTDVQQPNWDVSVNYVPVSFPKYVPAVIKMQEGTQEFWRVVNASANTIMDIQVLYDGAAQPLQIAALDGVPTGSKDGRHEGVLITQKDILLPPSSRAEFIVAAPAASTRKAQLVTLAIDGGEASDSNPARPLANIVATSAPVALPKMPAPDGSVRKMRFDDLANAKITAHRDLYFSEYFTSFGHETEGSKFFITVDGHVETLFDPNVPPAITTHRGAVEEWRIENRTQEVHEFHMHQIHFLVTAVNDKPIPKAKQQLYDTYQVGYWDGNVKHAYPSITIKLDFRGPTVGDFVYHCHILDHEDLGMMAIIRVLPPDKDDGRRASRDKSVKEASAVAIRSAAASP